MPNRILRDGILSSEAVCSLNWPAEVFYRRLMSVVDDYGRFHASPKLLRSYCYPQQIDKVSDSDIEKWLTVCVTAALVRVYPAQDGKRYLEIVKFGQQVRAKSKFPSPPVSNWHPPLALDSDCKQLLANAHLVVVEDGDVKTPPPPAIAVGAFEGFWSAWPQHPRKVAKAQCEAKWKSKGCEPIAASVIAAVEAQKRSEAWTKQGGEFIPSPLVWLNQGRWEAPSEVSGIATPSAAATAEVDRTAAYLAEQREHAAAAMTPEARKRAQETLARLRQGVGIGRQH